MHPNGNLLTDNNIHVYPGSREQRLLQLIYTLWQQLNDHQHAQLRPGIEQAGMGWALPSLDRHNEDDWLTRDEAAQELGIKPWTIRKWHDRYGLTPVKGRYRWGDLKDIIRQRNKRKLGKYLNPE